MALSEFEQKRCESEMAKFLESKRPPAHIRNQVDISYRFVNQSVEIFELRSVWNNPQEKIEVPVAKSTYVKSQKIWRIFWQRGDMKWHGYEPTPEVKRFEDFLAVVSEDVHCCFWG